MTKLREAVQRLDALLADYCPKSENGGIPEPIEPGKPIHNAVIDLEHLLPGEKLPPSVLRYWYALTPASRKGDPKAFTAAASMLHYLRLEYPRRDESTLDEIDQIILQVIPFDGFVTGPEIADLLNHSPTLDRIKHRIAPNEPMRREGFIGHKPKKGYHRLK